MVRFQQWFYESFIRSRLPVYFAIVVLLVIALLIVPLYFAFSNNLRSQITNINASLLSQIENQLDTLLKEIDRSSIKVLEDPDVKQFVFLANNGLFASEEEYQFALKKMYGKLAGEENIHGNMIALTLYVPGAGQAVMSKLSKPVKEYEDQALLADLITEDRPSSGWMGKRLTETNYISGYPAEQEVFSFYRLMTNDGMRNDALLLINIRLDRLNSLFNHLNSEYPLGIIIADEQEKLIYAHAKDIDIDSYLTAPSPQDEYFVSHTLSKYNGWSYQIAVPKRWLFAPMQFLTNATILLTLVVIIFGLFVSMYMTKRFYRPFHAMLHRLKGQLPLEAEEVKQVDELQYAFHRMMDYTEQYSKVMQENYDVIKNKSLLDILKGNKWPNQHYTPLKIDRSAAVFQVISCRCDDVVDWNERDKGLLIFAAVNIAEETIAYDGYQFEAVYLDELSFALLLSGGDGYPDEEAFQELLELAIQRLQLYLKHNWTIGAGRRYGAVQQIPASYRESQTALKYRIIRGSGTLIAYKELQLDDSTTDWREEDWLKAKDEIIQHIRLHQKSETFAAIKRFAEQIGQRAYAEGHLNRIYYYYNSIFMELETMIYELSLNRNAIIPQKRYAIGASDYNITAAELEQLLTACCGELIDVLSSQMNKAKSSQIQAVIAYIEECYGDQDLSLESIAERFHMNPSYFGQLLKKETNKTFLQYVSQVRITKAKELLDDHNLKIQDVAQAAGYGNRSTFIRVFKAQVGITPTEYRNRTLSI